MNCGTHCTKRRFGSRKAVRRAHAHARFRVRVYWCAECRAYHAAPADRSPYHQDRRDK